MADGLDGWDVFGDDDGSSAAPPPPKVARPTVVPCPRMVAAASLFADVEVPPPLASARLADSLPGSSEIWPQHPAIFTGPIELASDPSVGGGRGFLATRDLQPGELLLAEAPLLAWSEEDTHELLPMLRAVLGSPDALRAMRQLHPTQLTPALREQWSAERSEVVESLVPQLQAVGGHSAAEARDELLRLCLCLQFNGFASGLFLHQAIFNHACPLRANCDKASRREPAGTVSVVRATRAIRRGEPCLISYLQPPELSRAARRERLRQFDFGPDCTPDEDLDPPCCRLQLSEAGPSAGSGAAETECEAERRAEARLWALEQATATRLREALRDGAGGREGGGVAEAARAALEPLRAACGPRHLAAACAQRQVATALRRRLQAEATGGGSGDSAAAATALLLECSCELWQTQRLLLGPLHPECAQTLHDCAGAIRALLGCAPQLLFQQHPEWGSAALAAHAARSAERLHTAVAALYVGALPV